MLIKSRNSWDITENQVTTMAEYKTRRDFIKAAGIVGAGVAGSMLMPGMAQSKTLNAAANPYDGRDIKGESTDKRAILGYNNYYEFGMDKDDPARYAHSLVTDPWSVKVDGECAKPGTYGIEDLIDFNALEERIYRMRCVEAWSMVIPWIGVPLSSIIEKLEPTSKAKYIYFETLVDRETMSGIRRGIIKWPYKEGLRMDEAMHPLTIMAVGIYGETLANQNGAPMRLVVPWKYGFKGVKSIVRISFREREPNTSWMRLAPQEYGFYANVNPSVPHPRWSQAKERRIGDFARRPTLMFNGYGEQVAHLYDGMDLRKNY
ncbi:protein-methionine-sulfoxide reductase catalytic subunit MsrP [Pseudemcibacter aquimaris]|uniref:protein-methionine-sulfoxide reductase catalytic subunit MsrP n=1 Tax=Pseudemcibacter aquimaris TaxID=2857064 RepID=UPI00201381C4|nr:protein-methionine-sulfoxide reductase catalytic subunit MsrP [Pseudemcibacter aquimaris]MCC3862014.1 protein-methionine-sulfoxide reductase catalytic subunit MsrP [Pseudemcibacter aquimaris]WDU58766.1 protein-methionine-sulfoxide reductase catalytic subunit MsrP [Pseudemcibacter aquimaris]